MADLTLTTGSDTVAGTAGDDTVYATSATLNSGDSLTGGTGTDILSLSGTGTFRVDQLATFTGFEQIALNNASNSWADLWLGNQPVNVTTSGSYAAIHSASPSFWNATDAIIADPLGWTVLYLNHTDTSNVTYDLTSNTFSHVDIQAYGDSLTVKINSADAVGITRFATAYANGLLVAADATLDLSHTQVSGFRVTSTNVLGTTFTVSDLGTADQIAGGSGHDTIVATGFTFSADQRNSIFATASVERIVDTSGTYMTVDTPPTITSNGGADTAAISILENSTAVTTVTASDPDIGQTLGYSIIGGADAGKFTIGSSTGALSFVTAPDFELPTDAGGDNVYDVIVQASDGHGGIDTQAIAVSVQNVAGATINGTAGNDVIDMTHTVAGHRFRLPRTTPSTAEPATTFCSAATATMCFSGAPATTPSTAEAVLIRSQAGLATTRSFTHPAAEPMS